MPNIHHHGPYLQQGLKQQTLSITNTQQDLTGGIQKIPTPRICKFSNAGFYPTLPRNGGSQFLSNYSLLLCESLLSDFRYQLKYSLNTGPGYDPGTCGLWVQMS